MIHFFWMLHKKMDYVKIEQKKTSMVLTVAFFFSSTTQNKLMIEKKIFWMARFDDEPTIPMRELYFNFDVYFSFSTIITEKMLPWKSCFLRIMVMDSLYQEEIKTFLLYRKIAAIFCTNCGKYLCDFDINRYVKPQFI